MTSTTCARRSRSGAVVVRADGTPAALPPLEQRVDLRVGKVLSAKKHEEADKLVRVSKRARRVTLPTRVCLFACLDETMTDGCFSRPTRAVHRRD